MARAKITPEMLGRELKAREKGIIRAINRGMRKSARRGRTMLVGGTPKDQGQLKNAWTVKDTPMPFKGGLEVVNETPYAGIVEKGARPHGVSKEGWERIYNWVWRNRRYFKEFLTKKGNLKRGKSVKQFLPVATSSRSGGQLMGLNPIVAGITWGIVKRYKEEGQKATYFVRNMIPELRRVHTDTIAQELQKLARKRRMRGGK